MLLPTASASGSMVSAEPRTGSPAANTAIRTGPSSPASAEPMAPIASLLPMSAGHGVTSSSAAASLVQVVLAARHREHRQPAPGQPPDHGLPDRAGRPDDDRLPGSGHVPARWAAASRRAATSSARATSAGTPPMPQPSGGNWVM